MRRREIPQMPIWITIITVTAAIALGSVVFTLLRRDTITTDSAADRAFRSALLPDDWQTYGTDVWSIGYPGDWENISLEVVDNEESPLVMVRSLAFLPEDARGDVDQYGYFTVDQYEGATLATLAAEMDSESISETSEFLFAGYDAVKYTFLDETVVHDVSYEDTVYRITTRHFDDPEIGIMLATFQFLR